MQIVLKLPFMPRRRIKLCRDCRWFRPELDQEGYVRIQTLNGFGAELSPETGPLANVVGKRFCEDNPSSAFDTSQCIHLESYEKEWIPG